MDTLRFPFSDTIAGYVTQFNRDAQSFGIRTAGGQEYRAYLKANTYARMVQNLGVRSWPRRAVASW